MAFLVEKGPGAVTRPHFHQADQFQVVVAGRGMLGGPACAEHGCDAAWKRADVPEHFLALFMGGGLCRDHCRRGRTVRPLVPLGNESLSLGVGGRGCEWKSDGTTP